MSDPRIDQLETKYLRKLMARDAAVWFQRARCDERNGAPPDGWNALKSQMPKPGVKKGAQWSEARRNAQKRRERAA